MGAMPSSEPPIFDKPAMRRTANAVAGRYQAAAVLPREIADRLLEHMSIMRIQPTTIIDTSSRLGYSSQGLSQQYSQADVYRVDLADKMLAGEVERCVAVCADVEQLPFADSMADVIFSNLQLHAINDFTQTFLDFRRILKPGGLLIFSVFGPDTLKELRSSFVDDAPHVYSFVDMHDIGDALVHCGFSDPVMEMEKMTLTYTSLNDLFADLKGCAWQNAAVARSKQLYTKKKWQAMLDNYQQFKQGDKYPASFEIIYGHAWVGGEKSLTGLNENGEAVIPISSIKKRS